MNILLDYIGAALIGGMVLLMIMNLNTVSSMQRFSSDYELRLQQNAKTLAEILNNDMRKVGYGKSSNAIIAAQEKLFSFYSDIDSNGVVDIVTYKLGDSTDAVQTENPFDKPLLRAINNDTSKGPTLGLTNLKFSYKNKFGVLTTALDSIKFIKVEIWVQSVNKIEDGYPFTYWEMTVNPRNL